MAPVIQVFYALVDALSNQSQRRANQPVLRNPHNGMEEPAQALRGALNVPDQLPAEVFGNGNQTARYGSKHARQSTKYT